MNNTLSKLILGLAIFGAINAQASIKCMIYQESDTVGVFDKVVTSKDFEERSDLSETLFQSLNTIEQPVITVEGYAYSVSTDNLGKIYLSYVRVGKDSTQTSAYGYEEVGLYVGKSKTTSPQVVNCKRER